MLGFLNKRLKRHISEPYCTIITGDRGTGKKFRFRSDCGRISQAGI